jgi:hypothetical protein
VTNSYITYVTRRLRKAKKLNDHADLSPNELIVSNTENWNKENKKANRMIWCPPILWLTALFAVVGYSIFEDWSYGRLNATPNTLYDLLGGLICFLILFILGISVPFTMALYGKAGKD